MAVYRFRFYSADENMAGEEQQSFATDDAALKHARVLLGAHPVIEVWRRDRLLQRITRAGQSKQTPWEDV